MIPTLQRSFNNRPLTTRTSRDPAYIAVIVDLTKLLNLVLSCDIRLSIVIPNIKGPPGTVGAGIRDLVGQPLITKF